MYYILIIFIIIIIIIIINNNSKIEKYTSSKKDDSTKDASNNNKVSIFDSDYVKFMKELPGDIFTFLYSKALVVPNQFVKKIPLRNKGYIAVY